ncbi:hypothetical protein C8R44DRAFT_821851 [Mycena epipterygia]|nr:hypothetical protein C8R44DRAFT_821851 [Mycena epipterygia]
MRHALVVEVRLRRLSSLSVPEQNSASSWNAKIARGVYKRRMWRITQDVPGSTYTRKDEGGRVQSRAADSAGSGVKHSWICAQWSADVQANDVFASLASVRALLRLSDVRARCAVGV